MLEWSKPLIGLSGGFLGAVVHESGVLYKGFSLGRFCWAVFVVVLGAAIGLWLLNAGMAHAYPLIGGWLAAVGVENTQHGRQLLATVISKLAAA